MEKIKVLNLYAGIGGNRKLWENVDVTAVEIDPKIAAIYQHFFPQDKMVVGDAHQFLLEHFKEFDFIWSSPPCPTHTRFRLAVRHDKDYFYPDMTLYQEIIFLTWFCDKPWVVENVISYYEPLISPWSIDGHYFWVNYPLTNLDRDRNDVCRLSGKQLSEQIGFPWNEIIGVDKRKVLRNCVLPITGLKILNMAFYDRQKTLKSSCKRS